MYVDNRMENKTAQLHGSIFLEFRKSTKMSLTRYMALMENQLKPRIDGQVTFRPIPDYTKLYQGKIDKIIHTLVGLITMDIKLCCSRTTTENGEKFGHIAMQGTGKLGSLDLQFSLTMMSDFKWTSKEDLSQVQWQKLAIKLPPTHLNLDAMEGNFRLSFYDQMSRWEDTVIIDSKIQDIIKERGTQNVAMMDTLGHKTQPKGARPKQGVGYNTNMRVASAPSSLPLTPTPYRMEGKVESSTKTDLEHQNSTDLGGHTQTREGLPHTETKTIQYRPDENRGHDIPPKPEYETDIDRQPKTNVGMELHTNMGEYNQNNTIPTPPMAPSSMHVHMVPSSMHIPFNFPDHDNRDYIGGELNTNIETILDNVRRGLNNFPIDNSIHNVEGIQTNFNMEGHPDTYGDGPRGQLGTPQRYLSHYRQEPGNTMEVNLMGNKSPGVITYLGAIPKNYSQGRMNSIPCYNDLNQDPIEAQRQILAQCVNNTMRPMDTARAGVMGDQTSTTEVAVDQPGGVYRDSTHTGHGHGAYRSQEQSDYIQSLSEDQGSCSTVKQGVMKSISETLQGMKLREIRRFQQSLPENLSQARRSRRLMGSAPEAFQTTGNKIEDGRIIFNNDKVHYRR